MLQSYHKNLTEDGYENQTFGNAVGFACVSAAGRETDCSFRPWLSLPLAGVDPEDAGLRCSMSKKGCSPDNSACEGFFGHLKKQAVLQSLLAWDRNKGVYTDFERLFDLVS